MKKPIYILNLLNSIYLTYLICRINNNSINARGFILIITIILGIFLIKKLVKNLNTKKIKKYKKQIIFLTFTCSLLILSIGIKFFAANFNEVEVSSEKNEDITDYINDIQVDNISYIYNGECFKGIYEPYCTEKVKIIKETDYSKLRISNSYNINISFNDNAKNLIFNINNQTVKIEKNNYTYHVSSNYNYDYSSFIRGILSFEVIYFIILLVICSIVSADSLYQRSMIILSIITMVIGSFYFFNSNLGILFPDSESYISFSFSNFLKLQFSDRTPVYPAIIRIFRLLFMDNYLLWLCIFQYLLWFISVIFLYKVLCILTNEKIAFATSLLYAFSCAIIGWNNLVLTESIALSGTVIVIYNIIKYINDHKLINGIIAILISLILTFLRPTSLILVAGLFAFWIARFIFERKELKNDLKCFIGSVISIIVIVVYAVIFHASNGIYSITNAMVRQDLYVNIQEGYYSSSDDEKFVNIITNKLAENNSDLWPIISEVYEIFSNAEISAINRECRIKNIREYIKYVWRIINENAGVTFRSYTTYNNKLALISTTGIQNTFNVLTFLSSYIAIIFELIMSIYLWIKKKNVPWVDLGLFGFIFIIIISTFIGTNSEFMRTAICVVPFTYISYAMILFRFLGFNNMDKKIKNRLY